MDSRRQISSIGSFKCVCVCVIDICTIGYEYLELISKQSYTFDYPTPLQIQCLCRKNSIVLYNIIPYEVRETTRLILQQN